MVAGAQQLHNEPSVINVGPVELQPESLLIWFFIGLENPQKNGTLNLRLNWFGLGLGLFKLVTWNPKVGSLKVIILTELII